MDEVKKCTKCRDPMPADRRHTWCAPCMSEYMRHRRIKGTILNEAKRQIAKHKNAGELHGNSSITATQLADVLAMRAGGMTYKRISSYVGLSDTQISRICTGKAWRKHYEVRRLKDG